jgi:hypothetical protein
LQGQGFVDVQVDPQFTGTAKNSCEIDGSVDTQVLYNLVGGDIYLAGSQISITSAIKSLPEFAVSASGSTFQMVRVDGQYGAPNWNVDASDPKSACATVIMHQNDF